MPNQVLAKQGAVVLIGVDSELGGAGRPTGDFLKFQVVNLSPQTIVVRGVYFDPRTAPPPLGQPEPSGPMTHAALVIPYNGHAQLGGVFGRVPLDTPVRVRVAFILGGDDLELVTYGRIFEVGELGARIFRLDEAVAGQYRPSLRPA